MTRLPVVDDYNPKEAWEWPKDNKPYIECNDEQKMRIRWIIEDFEFVKNLFEAHVKREFDWMKALRELWERHKADELVQEYTSDYLMWTRYSNKRVKHPIIAGGFYRLGNDYLVCVSPGERRFLQLGTSPWERELSPEDMNKLERVEGEIIIGNLHTGNGRV